MATEASDKDQTIPIAISNKKRSAFNELMSSKPKQPKVTPPSPRSQRRIPPNHFSLGLIRFVNHPDQHPDEVIYSNDNIVLVKDKFPKATVHLLLLARNPEFHILTPIEAFSKIHDPDGKFLSMIKDEAGRARKLAASELQRILSPRTDNHVAGSDEQKQNWTSEIKVGVHAEPSMATLHVHIISRDMVSGRLKHKKHYNSFNSPFFIELDEFPLRPDDERLILTKRENLLKGDMRCWRCGENFGNQFARLREHLKTEFEDWRTTVRGGRTELL